MKPESLEIDRATPENDGTGCQAVEPLAVDSLRTAGVFATFFANEQCQGEAVMQRFALVVAGCAVWTGIGRGDDTLPLQTLQHLKEATVFVKVEAEASVHLRREDGRGQRSVDLQGGKFAASGS